MLATWWNSILLDQEVHVCGIYIVANPNSTLLFSKCLSFCEALMVFAYDSMGYLLFFFLSRTPVPFLFSLFFQYFYFA